MKIKEVAKKPYTKSLGFNSKSRLHAFEALKNVQKNTSFTSFKNSLKGSLKCSSNTIKCLTVSVTEDLNAVLPSWASPVSLHTLHPLPASEFSFRMSLKNL